MLDCLVLDDKDMSVEGKVASLTTDLQRKTGHHTMNAHENIWAKVLFFSFDMLV